MKAKAKIAVLIGCSAEREVSLMTAAGVIKALEEKGFQSVTVDIDADLMSHLKQEQPDAVFIASHGSYSEDGKVQGVLDIMGLPYVGSGVLASSVAMHKPMAKLLFQQCGLRTPASRSLYRQENWQQELKEIERCLDEWGAVVIKPAEQGSTIGLSIVRQAAELAPAIREAFRFDATILVEQMIEGSELTVPVLASAAEAFALPCIEILPKNAYYDYESKYSPGMSEHLIPPRLDEAIVEEAVEMALRAHRILGCRDISRSDFIADKQGRCWLLEVNTLPGMTPTSLVPDSAQYLGWSYADLIEKLLNMALSRR